MQIQCPSCSRVLDFPDDRAGQVVTCPGCGGQMQLPAEITVEPAAPRADPGPASPGGPTRDCPYCGEQILAIAQKCRHCLTMLSGPQAGQPGGTGAAEAVASGEGKKALVLGIIGVVIFCLPVVPIVLGALAIKYGKSVKDHPAEAGAGQAAVILGYIAVVLGSLVILGHLAKLAGPF